MHCIVRYLASTFILIFLTDSVFWPGIIHCGIDVVINEALSHSEEVL